LTVTILKGDCRNVLRTLPDESVHCVVTSPPYWGLRDYGVAGQIGLEASYTDFVEQMVAVFREVRRVLRPDGTLWLNLGDSYSSGGRSSYGTWSPDSKQATHTAIKSAKRAPEQVGIKPKDLCGIPWRVAFALQEDGWYLRQDIIWSKPNPMPESVRDRCTKAHEYLFLLGKTEKYYFDADAVAEDVVKTGTPGHLTPGKGSYQNVQHTPKKSGNKERKPAGQRGIPGASTTDPNGGVAGSVPWEGLTRNKRSVWWVATEPFPEAHFATFPPALIEPCILAGCPAGGTVLDPFGGAGTTGMVADRLGRNAILIELNPEYAAMAERRIKTDAGMFADVSST
jgi:DNA modification methylase